MTASANKVPSEGTELRGSQQGQGPWQRPPALQTREEFLRSVQYHARAPR